MTKETFTALILSSEDTLTGIAMSMLQNEKDCEDAIQTAILTAFEKLHTLRNEKYFKTWLVRILINVCNKQLKNRSRQAALSNDSQLTETAKESMEVRIAIEILPLKIRQVIVLYYFEQFSVKEISVILKIPKGTVMSRLARGRELLKTELS